MFAWYNSRFSALFETLSDMLYALQNTEDMLLCCEVSVLLCQEYILHAVIGISIIHS